MSALRDLDILEAAMKTIGFRLVHSHAGPTDSGLAEFSDGERTVKIIRDKSQWMFDGARRELEPLGVWRAFEITLEFRDALLNHTKRPSP